MFEPLDFLAKFQGVEITFAYLKPDTTCSFQRTSDVLNSIESLSGLDLAYQGTPFDLSGEFLERYIARSYYPKYQGYPFIPEAKEYLSRKKVLPLVYAGTNAVARLREATGATKPWCAEPGTIRYDFGKHEASMHGNIENVMHCSDSAQAVLDETALFLPQVQVSYRIAGEREYVILDTRAA